MGRQVHVPDFNIQNVKISFSILRKSNIREFIRTPFFCFKNWRIIQAKDSLIMN